MLAELAKFVYTNRDLISFCDRVPDSGRPQNPRFCGFFVFGEGLRKQNKKSKQERFEV